MRAAEIFHRLTLVSVNKKFDLPRPTPGATLHILTRRDALNGGFPAEEGDGLDAARGVGWEAVERVAKEGHAFARFQPSKKDQLGDVPRAFGTGRRDRAGRL